MHCGLCRKDVPRITVCVRAGPNISYCLAFASGGELHGAGCAGGVASARHGHVGHFFLVALKALLSCGRRVCLHCCVGAPILGGGGVGLQAEERHRWCCANGGSARVTADGGYTARSYAPRSSIPLLSSPTLLVITPLACALAHSHSAHGPMRSFCVPPVTGPPSTTTEVDTDSFRTSFGCAVIAPW